MDFSNINLYALDEKGENHLIAEKIYIADGVISRFKGLMLEKELKKRHAVLLYPCNSIHMFFMRFPLDVLYADKNLNVVKAVREIKPWRIDLGHKNALYTIELPAGTLRFDPKKILITKKIL
jgi:uncharacterized membrane protein (UPF0127 family)